MKKRNAGIKTQGSSRLVTYIWHSVGKGPIWLFLETEILRKIDEMVKKSKK